MSNFDLILKLFLQLSVILVICRVVSYIGTRFLKQANVVSEMIAGVLLGPSLLGLIFPHAQQWLFPISQLTLQSGEKISHQSMTILFALSQIGVVIYMFLVGLEFDVDRVTKHFKSASVIIVAGIVTPFSLGLLVTPYLYNQPDFFGAGITQLSAMLFVGASLSITAFPMLARILYENGIATTRLGTLALAAGSMDDVLAWCLLAVILATVKSKISIALIAVGATIFYITFMLTLGRKIIVKVLNYIAPAGELTMPALAVILCMVMFCAWFTDLSGIYAIFGAFVAGVAMPRGLLADQLRIRVEYLTTAFLLPTFFVFSGLNTQIGLLNSPALFGITAIVIVLAIIGKGVGCTLASRAMGENWHNSLIIGTLMNSRGLMELIILNIGLSYHIITPTLFTMLVLMAIVTTVMTSPIYHYIRARQQRSGESLVEDDCDLAPIPEKIKETVE